MKPANRNGVIIALEHDDRVQVIEDETGTILYLQGRATAADGKVGDTVTLRYVSSSTFGLWMATKSTSTEN